MMMKNSIILAILVALLLLCAATVHAAVYETEEEVATTITCPEGQTACGNRCYDEEEQICYPNNVICPITQVPCGNQCYEPEFYKCVEGSCISRPRIVARNVILLVHGAWHTAGVWDNTKNLLEQEYDVEAVVPVVMTGHISGTNRQCINPIPSSLFGSYAGYYASINLASYANALTQAIIDNSEHGNIHIFAHSLSGAFVQHILSTMNETVRDNVKSVVFLSAYLTAPGKSVLEYTTLHPEVNRLVPSLVAPFAGAPMLCVNTSLAGDIFYSQCDAVTKQKAVNELIYEPTIPIAAKLENNLKDLDMRQIYVRGLQDQALPLITQQYMYNEQKSLGNCRLHVRNMNGDHSPMLCQTRRFVRRIARMIKLRPIY